MWDLNLLWQMPLVSNRVPTWTIEHDQCEINTPNKRASRRKENLAQFPFVQIGKSIAQLNVGHWWLTAPRLVVLRAGGYHLRGLEYDGRSCLGCHRNQVIVYLSTVTTKVHRWTRAYKLNRVVLTNEYIYLWWLNSYMMRSEINMLNTRC